MTPFSSNRHLTEKISLAMRYSVSRFKSCYPHHSLSPSFLPGAHSFRSIESGRRATFCPVCFPCCAILLNMIESYLNSGKR
jgi:hypothetical protein